MAHKDRKTAKKRGSKTHGYGNRQKHRGAGSRGGKGMAGSKNNRWSFISKNFPGYFGRKGFKRPLKVLREEGKDNIINVGEIEREVVIDDKIKTKEKIEVNLKELGYDKLLSKGKVSRAFIITVDKYSSKALKKIEEAGGKIESGSSKTIH